MAFFSWLRPRPSHRARRAQRQSATPRYRPRFEALEDRLCLSGVSFGPAVNWAAGDEPHEVVVADFNGDGCLDLAVANLSLYSVGVSDSVSVLLGNGSGGFTAPLNVTVGDRPISVAVGDFNGNGHADLAVANILSNNVSVLDGDGTGNFGSASVDVGLGPDSVAVGDFNGDDRADLAVANFTDDNVSVLLGDGSGGFAPPLDFDVGDGPVSVAVGDFNGNGRADLAVANQFTDNVSVLIGDGTGNFGSALSVTVGDSPQSVAVGDFNNDRRSDLAVANYSSDNVSVLLGNGSGGFAAPVNWAAGATPFSVAVADFNNDGRPDLAVANDFSDNVSVLLGNGSGGFTAPVNYAVGDAPHFVAVGDFNNDGRADLATANFESGNVSVLLNTTPPNQPPVANPDTFSVDEDNALAISAPGVLGNDTDVDSPALTAALVSTTAHGVLTQNADGSFAYSPNSNFSGTDSFTYQASDGSLASNVATVTITVNPANDAPVNSVPAGAQSVARGKSLTFSHATGNAISIADTDASTALIEISLSVLHGTLTLAGTAGLTFQAGDGTSDGSLTFRGTIAAINAALDGLTYTPAKGYAGGDSLTITTSDLGSGLGYPLLDADLVAILVKGKK